MVGGPERCGCPSRPGSILDSISRWALEPVGKAACWAGRERSPPQRGGWDCPVSYRARRLVMMKTVAHQAIASWCSGRRS